MEHSETRTSAISVGNQESDKGNFLSIFLLIIPVTALIYAWFQREYFIPPVDFQGFLLFSLKTSSIACLALFVLSFWKAQKTATLAMLLIMFEIFWCFGGLALLPVLNVKYDTSEPKIFEKKVIQVYRGSKKSNSFIRVESWGNPSNYLHPPSYLYDSVQESKSVMLFTTRGGYLGHEYITSLDLKE